MKYRIEVSTISTVIKSDVREVTFRLQQKSRWIPVWRYVKTRREAVYGDHFVYDIDSYATLQEAALALQSLKRGKVPVEKKVNYIYDLGEGVSIQVDQV